MSGTPMKASASDSMLVNVRDVLTILGISRRQLYRLIGRGEFPAPIRLGNRTYRWKRGEIEAYLDSRRTQPAGP